MEFLVELRGRKRRWGIGALLNQPRGVPSFADLLQEYTLAEGPTLVDHAKERLEGLVEEARRALSSAKLAVEVVALPGEEETFCIRLDVPEGGSLEWPPEVSVVCWPITLPARSEGVAPGTGRIASLGPLSAERITSFIAFEATAASGELSATRRFVLNLPLEGAPPDRRERILRTLLDKSDKVLRLILLLLAEGRGDDYEAMREIRWWFEGNEGTGGVRAIPSGVPLFEEMVLALGRDGESLDRVARLLEDLRKTEDGRRLIPEGLEEIREPIWAARQRSKR